MPYISYNIEKLYPVHLVLCSLLVLEKTRLPEREQILAVSSVLISFIPAANEIKYRCWIYQITDCDWDWPRMFTTTSQAFEGLGCSHS